MKALRLIIICGCYLSRIVDSLSSSVGEGRRPFLSGVFASAVILATPPETAQAEGSSRSTTTATKEDLLQAIADDRSESEILQMIEQLPRTPNAAVGLDGSWKLLWSAKADAFSPLLKLPKPLKPDSYQYLGPQAAVEVGAGRLAQGLTGGILSPNNQLWLSSGATTDERDASILKIVPPFRLEIGGPEGSTQPKRTLVQAGSDADFRKVNARTVEAQQAGANLYQQLYLERDGAGSLRVSKIIAGDPVIVGAVFVHQKL